MSSRLAAHTMTIVLPLLASSGCLFFGGDKPKPDAAATATPPPVSATAMKLTNCDEFLADPVAYFQDGNLEAAVSCSESALNSGQLSGEKLRDVMTTMGMFCLADTKDDKRIDQAKAACLGILKSDPYGQPSAFASPDFVNLFVQVQRDVQKELPPPPPGIRTVAIGNFSYSAPVKCSYDLQQFAIGLQHHVEGLMMEGTSLQVVDRQYLDQVKTEIRMSRDEDIVDPNYRVAFGKVCGAQSYIFGHVQSLEPDLLSVTVRWVEVATSKVLINKRLDMKVERGRDLAELERKMVIDVLSPQIETLLGGQDVQQRLGEILKQSPEQYLKAATLAGAAILAERRGEDSGALWAMAAQANPSDRIAMAKARMTKGTAEISKRGS